MKDGAGLTDLENLTTLLLQIRSSPAMFSMTAIVHSTNGWSKDDLGE
jgi:hypothetical protein